MQGRVRPSHGDSQRIRHPQDLVLVREARGGSASARRELAGRLQCVPRVLSALSRRLGNPLTPEDLEDAAQDVAAALWRRLDSYTGRSALESWAYGFCYNVLCERLRAQRRRPRHVAQEDDPMAAPAEPPASEHLRAVRQALAHLEPKGEAELVHLRHYEGLTFQQLGELYGITANAAKKRYHRILGRLRAALGPLHRGGAP